MLIGNIEMGRYVQRPASARKCGRKKTNVYSMLMMVAVKMEKHKNFESVISPQLFKTSV